MSHRGVHSKVHGKTPTQRKRSLIKIQHKLLFKRLSCKTGLTSEGLLYKVWM